MKKAGVASCVVLAMAAILLGQAGDQAKSGTKMTAAAQNFMKQLTAEQRKLASFKYSDPERLNWHFIPRERKGLALKDLEGAALKTAHQFIASGLSDAGYDQALNVMSLEELLYLLESGDRNERRSKRDPQKYYLSVFGTPAKNGVWGWRVEGHHLSLNYTIQDGVVVASTPEFFGANPGTVNAGPGRFIRVLGPEEDLARQILKLCDATQEKVAWIEKKAPRDLRGGGVAQPDTTEPVGLAFSKMSNDQKKLVGQLLSEYLKNMPSDIERERRAAIKQAGLDHVHFAWWGDADRDQPHYYRVQGPTFLIEYNNTQNQANHVHSIWRDMAGDFNVRL